MNDSGKHLSNRSHLCQLLAQGYNRLRSSLQLSSGVGWVIQSVLLGELMIESIQFKNFKALRDTVLSLGRFTLIVGPNGSGKSTGMQALKATSNPHDISFDKILSVGLDPKSSSVEVILRWGEKYAGTQTTATWEIDRVRGPVNTFHIPSREMNDEVLQKLQGVRLFSLIPQEMSKPSELLPDDELQADGAHLAGVLDRVRDLTPERFEALNKTIEQWLPEFDRILFETPGKGLRTFSLRTRLGHHAIPATELSQGILLALAIISFAFLPNPPSILCIEEPDRGIHPRLLRDVQSALYRLSHPEDYREDREPVQVIATTHSPYLLDLYRDHPEEVVIANKTDEGTKFERLSDQPYLEEILRDSHLGEIWYTGILGGVPVHS